MDDFRDRVLACMLDEPVMKWKSLPVQFIRAGNDVVLKRGCTEIRFSQAKYADLLAVLIAVCRSGATEPDILTHFEEGQLPTIYDLLKLLKEKNILVPLSSIDQEQPKPESPLDVFYWHFEPGVNHIADKLRSHRIVLVGDGMLSQELARSLGASGFNDVTTVNYPSPGIDHSATSRRSSKQQVPCEDWLRETNGKAIGCLVVTSDFGGRDLMREWNTFAMQSDCPFLPVVLQNMVGYIGPLVIPRETACYECLVARENSHLDHYTTRREIEQNAHKTRHVVGYHPLMLSALAVIAAFELVKFHGDMVAHRNAGTLIEVDLLGSSVTSRKVLKIPRCQACSDLLTQPSLSIHQPFTPPQAQNP
jgi:bacteriocin biosynthesis cyclodehydratase domain-containing protein